MKSLFRLIVYGICIYIVFSLLIRLFTRISGEDNPICQERTVIDEHTLDQHHIRTWYLSSHSKDFCTQYRSQDAISKARGLERNTLYIEDEAYHKYWGHVYRNLISQNSTYIGFIADSLLSISVQEQLDPMSFAELIVTFVQDIPYSYVLHIDCSTRENKNHPCVGNQAFGILSPYEFLHTLSGDCDTRAALLYTLLERLGFDPMIVISSTYGHAMLAVNLPAAGDYIVYGRNKYYFWETTATGWPIGMLPPEFSNVNYWKIALVNEL